MNTEDRATTSHIVPVVSDNKSDDDSIGSPQLSGGEILGNNGTPARPIPHEPPPQKSSEGSPEG